MSELINFSHRLEGGNDLSSLELADTINAMTGRAGSVAMLLSNQFAGDGNQFADEIINDCLDEIIKELQDIRSVVNGYHQSAKNRGV